jgi:hypothetical protein
MALSLQVVGVFRGWTFVVSLLAADEEVCLLDKRVSICW